MYRVAVGQGEGVQEGCVLNLVLISDMHRRIYE